MGRGWKISGREKFLDFYWCKLEENKSVPGGGGVGAVDLLRCSERKSVWPRYHGSKISGGVCCAFHKHAQPRFQSSSGISDVTFPVKTREL